MSRKNITIVILIIIAIVLLFFNGWLLYHSLNNNPPEPTYVTIRDSIYIDSIRVVEKTKTLYITHDSILYIHQTDSIIDTVYVLLPIDHKIYRDTLENDSSTYDISIRYSGWHSSIDEVTINSLHTTIVDIPLYKPRKWHVALTAGMYCGYDLVDKGVYCGPGAGISISYDLW